MLYFTYLTEYIVFRYLSPVRPGLRILPPETAATPNAQASSQPPTQPVSQPARALKSNSLSLFYKKCKPPIGPWRLFFSALKPSSLDVTGLSPVPSLSVPAGLHQAENALLLPAVLSPWAGADHLDPVPAHPAARTRADERSSPGPGHLTKPAVVLLLTWACLIVVCLIAPAVDDVRHVCHL